MTHVPRILVVDSDPLARFTVRRALVEHGCEVAEANDVVTAGRVLAEPVRVFDVVLLDYETPDSDDLSLITRLRALPPASRVVVMTSYATSQMLADAARLGVSSVLHKPIDLDELCRLVTSC
jgi:two-component system cell cycle sensor histidine kinase/response regulator CckA